MTNYFAQRIKEQYNPDGGDIAVGPNGKIVPVTWAEFALLEMIEAQQAEISTLKTQVENLVEAVPSAGVPENDGSNLGRYKLFKV